MTDEIVTGRPPSRGPGGRTGWERHRRTLLMTGAVFVVLLVIGIGAARNNPAPEPTPSASPSAGTTTSTVALQLTGTRCASLDGNALSIGFEVSNAGGQPVTVRELEPSFPLGGLTAAPTAAPDTSSCGQPAVGIPAEIVPGGSALFAFVVTPKNPACIGPLVVHVTVDYQTSGGSGAVDLAAFPDLGGFGLPGDC